MPENNKRERRKLQTGQVYFEGSEDLGKVALNRLAREQTKLRLLADIKADLLVCEIEGWDKKEYLNELKELICSFDI